MAEPDRLRSALAPNSAPRDPEELRALLQARIARFMKAMVIFNAACAPLGVVYYATQGSAPGRAVARELGGGGAVMAVLLITWLATRKGRRSMGALHAIDAISTTLYLAAMAVVPMGDLSATWARPDLAVERK
jgi:hypothetical protein